MARAALGIGVRELGKMSGVSANTISRFENGSGATVNTVTAIKKALEEAGVVFIPSDGDGGPGVRFKRAPESD